MSSFFVSPRGIPYSAIVGGGGGSTSLPPPPNKWAGSTPGGEHGRGPLRCWHVRPSTETKEVREERIGIHTPHYQRPVHDHRGGGWGSKFPFDASSTSAVRQHIVVWVEITVPDVRAAADTHQWMTDGVTGGMSCGVAGGVSPKQGMDGP